MRILIGSCSRTRDDGDDDRANDRTDDRTNGRESAETRTVPAACRNNVLITVIADNIERLRFLMCHDNGTAARQDRNGTPTIAPVRSAMFFGEHAVIIFVFVSTQPRLKMCITVNNR
jgi:hypothetical protein